MEDIELTVVVPVYNEAPSLADLYHEVRAACDAVGRSWEVVLVNDGSTDGSDRIMDELAAADDRVRTIHFRTNFGKSPALSAGFDQARGRIIVTLDADLQDDPALIPEFVARIDKGADLVSGWKQKRHDPWGKRLPSHIFNRVVRMMTGIPLHDFNCGFKAYTSACVRELSIYTGYHRFIPVLAADRGFRIDEIVVRHRPRRDGVSKYGPMRLFYGFIDLLTVLFVTRYRTRPLRFFGVPGAIIVLVGVAMLLYLSALWTMGEPIGTRPLLTLGVLLTITGTQFVGIGLLGELLVQTRVASREIFSRASPDERARRAPLAAAPAPAPEEDEARRQAGAR